MIACSLFCFDQNIQFKVDLSCSNFVLLNEGRARCFVHAVTKLQDLICFINISMSHLFYCQDKWPPHLFIVMRLSDLSKVKGLVVELRLNHKPPNTQVREYSTIFSPQCLLYTHNKRCQVTFLECCG